MKNLSIVTATFIAVFVSAFGSTSLHAAQQTLRIDVDGLVCAFCAQGIEKKMKAQAATDKVFVSLEKKVVALSLKDGQDITDEKIKSEITDAGYAVRGITRLDDSFEALKAKIKASPDYFGRLQKKN